MPQQKHLYRYAMSGLKRMTSVFRDRQRSSHGGEMLGVRLPPMKIAKSTQNISWISWTPRDIGLFLKGARTDAKLEQLLAKADVTDHDVDDASVGPQRLRAAAFDRLYAENDGDPWKSASPRYAYQSRKYDALVRVLDRDRTYHRALDVGCGTGLLTERLAPHCDKVLAFDISSVAVEHAKVRNSHHKNTSFFQHDFTAPDPPEWKGMFDLIVVADALYYLPASFLGNEELKIFARRFAAMLASGGVLLVANHYFFEFDSASRLTRRIHRAMEWSPWFRPLQMHRRAFYLAGSFERTDSQSPQADQIVRSGLGS